MYKVIDEGAFLSASKSKNDGVVYIFCSFQNHSYAAYHGFRITEIFHPRLYPMVFDRIILSHGRIPKTSLGYRASSEERLREIRR